MSIQYTCNISKYHEVYANLSETSDLFYQSLTERVDIEKYSRKLVAKAQRVEAWVNNKLVGLLAYYKNEDENVLYISNVSVLKEYQGQGIASYLIEKLKNNREKKYEKIKLMVFSEDKTAIDFYKKNGFYLDKKVGEQNEMYFRFETIVPVVSVCCVTYNHASYIRQCLDGFIMQKTTFPIEILIHEDASTDGTADIIREYESKYPEIIKPIYQTENQYSKGVAISATYNWPRVQGKYIAQCEGDDYWTDPYKLQKQVDFLEANPDFSICFHKVKMWKQKEQEMVDDFITKDVADVTNILNLAEGNYIHTPSVVFRKKEQVFSDMQAMGSLPAGDYVLHLLNAQYGKIKKLPDCMAVYRFGVGIWSKNEYEISPNRFAWVHVLVALMKYFKQNDEVYEALSSQLNELSDSLNIAVMKLCDDYSHIINTQAYRLGKILLKPVSWLRKLKS